MFITIVHLYNYIAFLYYCIRGGLLFRRAVMRLVFHQRRRYTGSSQVFSSGSTNPTSITWGMALFAIHLRQQVTDFNHGWQKKLLVKTDSRRYQELGGATQSVWEPVSTRFALNVYYLPHSCLWWQERNLATVHARFIGRLCLFDTQSTEKSEPF